MGEMMVVKDQGRMPDGHIVGKVTHGPLHLVLNKCDFFCPPAFQCMSMQPVDASGHDGLTKDEGVTPRDNLNVHLCNACGFDDVCHAPFAKSRKADVVLSPAY